MMFAKKKTPSKHKKYIFSILSLILFTFISLYLWARSRLPDYEGRLEAEGISSQVEILRDSYGMPHIYAKKESDLYFALGYATAQDRLFQMDMMRRAIGGRLSEILGESTIQIDRLFLTLRGGQQFEETLKKLPAKLIQIYKSYARGINHFIENKPLPIEFSLLGYRPEPWKYSDGVAAYYYIAWSLNSAFYAELTCAFFIEKFGIVKGKEFCPTKSPFKKEPGILDLSSQHSLSKIKNTQGRNLSLAFLLADTQARELFQVSQWGASNNWIISSKKSESNGVLLANDMHLHFSLPGVWYEAHLVSPELNISGVTLAALPHIMVGSNTHVAWAFTNVMADDSDFYYETIDPKRPDYYQVGKRFVKMRIIEERIPVKGQEDIPLKIRVTRHGPIINSVQGPQGENLLMASKTNKAVAMRWTVREHHLGPLALYKLNHAKNIRDIEKASSYFRAPALNWVYGDKEGNIGYTFAGCIPKRRGFDGSLPLDGASGRYEWGPCLPLNSRLRMRNPKRGWIASANEKHSSKHPHPISHYYAPPYRSMRIRELLREKEKLSRKDFQRMHNDSKILAIEEWRPLLKNMDQKNLSPFEKEALQILLNWDGFAHAQERPGATIFFAFYAHLHNNFFGKRLNEKEQKVYYRMMNTAALALRSLLQKEKSELFDDPKTPKEETRDDLILKSFQEAIAYLKESLGSDIKDWEWGEIHQLTFYHFLGRASRLLGFFLNRGPFAPGGGNFALKSNIFKINEAYEVMAGASMRYIIDLNNPDQSLRVIPTGISGNFLSPHYDDQMQKFIDGKYRPFVFSRREVIKDAKRRLLLVPSPKNIAVFSCF